MGEVVQLRDYHLKRMERDAAKIIGQVIDYTEIARVGGPGGIDDLIIIDSAPCEMPFCGDSGDCA